jgi:hypothetical protein
MADRYLVLFDANRIKEYVFATGRLKEIRGASEIVRSLTESAVIEELYRELFQRDLGAGLIYAGGAAGALVIESEQDAEMFRRALESHYRQGTGGATLSAVAEPINGPSKAEEAQAQNRAARALARRKAATPRAEVIPSGGYIRFCDADRLYPASQPEPDQDRPGGWSLYSASTAQKRRIGLTTRRGYFDEAHPFWEHFIALVEAYRPGDASIWEAAATRAIVMELEDIGAQSRPPGYIALVYADGDGIGKRIQTEVKAGGFASFSAFSNALERAAARAAATALFNRYKDWARDSRPDALLPFEVITIGGDDVLLICTGDGGLDVAATLASAFSQEIDPQVYPGLSASVGVVIAHDSHPIVNLRERAGELLKSAKRVDNGGVDFHIVSTPGLEPIERVRDEQYAPPHGDGTREVSYTMRPYSVAAMHTLLSRARAVAQLPGSKRAQLYDACLRNPYYVAATLEVLRVQMRLGTARSVVLEALTELQVKQSYPFLRNPDTRRFETPLIDLLEAAEFVPEVEQSEEMAP